MIAQINVLVTAIGGGGYGEQVLKALRLAKSSRYRLYGADASPICPQFCLVESHAVLPLANSPDYLDRLLELCDKFQINAVFLGCEPELKVVSKNRELFSSRGILLFINSNNVINNCMDKARTFELLQAKGFTVPYFRRVSTIEDLKTVDVFPVVVKPSLGGGGSTDVFIAQSRKELVALGVYLDLENSATDFVVQEYVGTPNQEFTVGILHDLEGNYMNSIALRRLLTSQLNIRSSVPNRTGLVKFGSQLVVSSGVSHGEIGRFSEVTSQCSEVAELLGSKGPLNIQCRLVNGEIRIFEINPRFSGTTSLRAMVGYNEPDILLRRHFWGEEIENNFKYKEATILRTLNEEMV